MEDVSYRESHVGKGQDYHSSFRELPHRRMMWQLERRALDQIYARFVRGDSVEHLDFACGTGRLLGHFSERVTASVGVDVSSSMLAVARDGVPSATLIEQDLTRSDVLGDREFDLITSFRFFPNAEPSLRSEVMAVLVEHLKPGGVLVFNNHMRHESLRHRLARVRGRAEGKSMTDADVRQLLDAAGLELVERVSLAVLPLSDEHMFLPEGLALSLESVLPSIPGLRRFAQDVIHVCRKAGRV